MDKGSKKDFENEFKELAKYTLPGYLTGLLLGSLLDFYGYQQNPIGQWLVRTFSGEGESIFEGIYSIKQRFRGAMGSISEAYGWGKLFGMGVPWIIDLSSRLAGINIYGIEGFYVPYFYALSDQIGANISGLFYLKRSENSWSKGVEKYIHHPVMLSSLTVIIIVPIGLLLARVIGFSPTTQTYTALETIAANLCWVPPIVGWIWIKYNYKT